MDEAKKRPPNVQANGDCYEAAFNWVFEHCLHWISADRKGDKGIFLVHGEVRGQGPIAGLRYGHAWVEDGDMVIDQSNGRNIRMPKVAYYALGGVYPDTPPFKPNLHRYTPEEARGRCLETKIYGPWDLETESGL